MSKLDSINNLSLSGLWMTNRFIAQHSLPGLPMLLPWSTLTAWRHSRIRGPEQRLIR